MAYEPTVWKSGDVVTSAKLNKLEEGVANAGMYIIDYDSDTYPSYNDITNAVKDGKTVVVLEVDGDNVILFHFNTAMYNSELEAYAVYFYSLEEEGTGVFRLLSSTKTDPMTT